MHTNLSDLMDSIFFSVENENYTSLLQKTTGSERNKVKSHQFILIKPEAVLGWLLNIVFYYREGPIGLQFQLSCIIYLIIDLKLYVTVAN